LPDRLPADLLPFLADAAFARPRPPTKTQVAAERERCAADSAYFISHYCQIYDNVSASWIPFALWDAQARALGAFALHKFLAILKARQNGLTWLVVADKLHKMLFRPIREVLLFSQRDDEAIKLLERLHGMYDRLPPWLQQDITADSAHEFRLANGSRAQALPASSGGRSNAATDVVIDEADFTDDLALLISNVRPTIDAGDNTLIVLSTRNEDTPGSHFQQLCRVAMAGGGLWGFAFLGVFDNPNRTAEWYAEQEKEALSTYGTLDRLYKHYPRTADEALSARSLSVRYSPAWLRAVSQVRDPLLTPADAPQIPGLRLYILPRPDRTYGLGADPAGGTTDSDDSFACVVDAETLEQCAVIQNKVEPTQFANYAYDLSLYYNNAADLFELNNHGHAFLAQSKERGANLRRGMNRRGNTERDAGWVTSERSKNALYDTGEKALAEVIGETKDEAGGLHLEACRPILFDRVTILQLSIIDVNTLKAPEGSHDDAASSWTLAVQCVYRGGTSMFQVAHGLWKALDVPRLVAPTLQKALSPGQTIERTDELAWRVRNGGKR